MRNSCLILIFILGFALPASAQISYGVKAGVNLADVSFAEGPDVPSDRRFGPSVGVFAVVPLWKRIAVQPEALYTVKGASFDVAGFKSDYIVDYVEIPVLARVALTRSVYAFAGPSMAYRLRARNRIAFGGSTEEIDVADDVETLDTAVVAGVGFNVGRWLLDGRLTYGVSDTDTDTSDEVRIRNRAFSMSAGFRF